MRADAQATPLPAREDGERGMRLLLTAVVVLLVIINLFDMQLSLGLGLSAENGLLYLLAGFLAIKMIVQQSFVFQMRALHVCFGVLIVYAVFSYLVAAFVVDYSRYDPVRYGVALKSRLVDQATYFLVFFYALRDSRNAHAMIKVLLSAVGVGAMISVLNAFGVVQIGVVGENDKGRVESLMGEPNNDAAFLSLFVPGFVAMMLGAHSWRRMVWFVALLAALGALVLTASRGGFLAVLLSSVLGAAIFRRHVPLRRMASFAAWAVALFAGLLVALSVRYGGLLYRRIIEDSTYTDVASASSGRIEMWSNALEMMAAAPLTLLTGFGWEVYGLMPFRYAPHNHYLGLYFNLGVVGVVCALVFVAVLVREARAAIPFAPEQYGRVLIGFAIGVVAISIAAFFVDLYVAWIWFWSYAGLAMRIAANARSEYSKHATPATPTAPAPEPSFRRDPFGWVGSTR